MNRRGNNLREPNFVLSGRTVIDGERLPTKFQSGSKKSRRRSGLYERWNVLRWRRRVERWLWEKLSRTQVELNPSLESFKNLRAAGFERTIREQVKTSLRHLQTIELNPSLESLKNLWKRETRCIELMPLSQWSTKRNETYSSTRSVVHHSNPLRIFARKTLRRIERWV